MKPRIFLASANSPHGIWRNERNFNCMVGKHVHSSVVAVLAWICLSARGVTGEQAADARAHDADVAEVEDRVSDAFFDGLEWELIYTGEVLRNIRGGADRGGAYRGDLSLYLSLSTEEAGWWDRGEFFLHAQEQHGNGITDRYVGDFQVLSNIDADDFVQVSEVWYRHVSSGGRFWLKAGKQDATADFAYTLFGGEFINSSPGFSPTIPLVTYPDPDWGVAMEVTLSRRLAVRAGVYQGRPDGGRSIGATARGLYGPMLMVESSLEVTLWEHPAELRLGYWYNGDRFDRLDGAGKSNGASGIYAVWDQLFYRENSEVEDRQGAGIFLQYGYTGGHELEAAMYFGAGFQWIGAISGRDMDVAGLGLFRVEFNPEAGFPRSAETVLEVFYEIQVTHRLLVKPDIQLISNPGGTDNETAVAGGVRWEIVF
jgi:porin